MKHLYRAVVVGTLSVAASAAFAQKAGEWIVGFGWTHISTNETLGPTNTTGSNGNSAVTDAYNARLAGATAHIGGKDTLQFGATYMVTDNIGAELSLGVAPKLTMDLSTPAAGSHPGALSARSLTPVLFAKYFFMSPTATFRPFIGLGVTHLSFRDAGYNHADAAVGTIAGKSISLSSSWAPAYSVGGSYKLNEKWSLNGAVTYIPLKTNATLVGPGAGVGDITTTSTLKLNPTAYCVALGYTF